GGREGPGGAGPAGRSPAGLRGRDLLAGEPSPGRAASHVRGGQGRPLTPPETCFRRHCRTMKKNPFRDAFAKGELYRRDLHKLMMAAGLGLATLPFGGGRASAAASDLHYFTWTGYDLPGFFPGYVEKHGGPPSISLFADEEEALQKLRAGFQCDLAHPC